MVMSVIAPDAVFVESGTLETRAQYEANHLPADIEVERQVTGARSPWRARRAIVSTRRQHRPGCLPSGYIHRAVFGFSFSNVYSKVVVTTSSAKRGIYA